MDVPTAKQSQTPCQPWAGQNGWSPASPQGPSCNPLPIFQHLSLSSPSDQRPCYEHLQPSDHSCQSDSTTFSYRSTLYADNADQSEHRIIPDAHVSSMVSAASQGRNIPPCSLPLMKEGMTPCKLQQMPFYSPYSPYQGISSPFQPPPTQQGSLNGPQSPHQKHLPISPPSFSVNQSPQCTPQPAFESPNVESSVGYTHNHASPTSPIQQQPQWTPAAHSRGKFIWNVYMTCLHVCCRATHGLAPSSRVYTTAIKVQL